MVGVGVEGEPIPRGRDGGSEHERSLESSKGTEKKTRKKGAAIARHPGPDEGIHFSGMFGKVQNPNLTQWVAAIASVTSTGVSS